MSTLTLTPEEQEMAIMDTPDKPLADAVRHCYAIMHTVAEKLDKPVMAVAAQHACVFLAKETNAGTLNYTIRGLTCKDDDLGDWHIHIKRLEPDQRSTVEVHSKETMDEVRDLINNSIDRLRGKRCFCVPGFDPCTLCESVSELESALAKLNPPQG